MPSTKSSKKRLRQNIVHRDRNRSVKSAVRSRIRQVREAIDGGDVEKSEAAFQLAVKKIDQAAAKRIFHPNKAARTKSRLSDAIIKLKAE